MKKILEIKGTDWLKGHSTQAGISLGGVFRTATNFNPFELMGFLQGSLSPTELTSPANSIRVLTSWNASGLGYLYAHTQNKLYQYLTDSPYTQTDVSAQINVTQPVAGAIIWKGKYVYAQYSGDVKVFANTLPVALASNVEILTNVPSSTLTDVRPMCVGADKNLYIGTKNAVSQLTSSVGVPGNDYNKFPIDTGYTVRDIINDGKYLVILADNNSDATTSLAVGSYNCRVYFWDMGKATADTIWDINDSYLIGGGFLDGKVYVFGYNGIYVTNIVTQPKMIWDFRGNSTITKRPKNCYSIAEGSQDIYWADGSANGQRIFSLRGTVFSSPYSTHDSTYAHTALTTVGDALVAAVDAPKLYIHNVGSDRGSATAWTANEVLPQPYTYGFTKVVLKAPLTAGQSVTINVFDSNGRVVANTLTKSYTTDPGKKVLIFGPNPLASTGVKKFEDVSVLVNPVAGAIVERVCVYGEPSDEFIQF